MPSVASRLSLAAVWMIGASCASPPDRVLPIDSGEFAEWQKVDPAAVGLDSSMLALARSYAFRPEHYTQSVVIIRDGHLAAEWYAEGAGPESFATSWSVGKSFAAILVGIAIDNGAIPLIDAPMTTFVPEWSGTDRADITLRDVLTMASGLDWSEDYSDFNSDVARMVLESDPLAVVLAQPVAAPRGQRWYYSSGDSMLLSRVLERATGKTAEQLAQDQLARPLSMSRFEWWNDASNNTYTFCCIDAPARDFAKFGQLLLQRGSWGGQTIVSSAWVDAATSAQAPGNPGYGYQFWTNQATAVGGNWPSLPESTYFAVGVDEQYIAIIPELNMVIVRNGRYVKPDRPPIADQGLAIAGLVPDGLLPTGSTAPEDSWRADELFGLIRASVID